MNLFELTQTESVEELYPRSILVGTEGPDIGWYILPLPDGQWVAWDDADPADPGFEIFDSREEALTFQHEGYRAKYPEDFTPSNWIPVAQVKNWALSPAAIRQRIREGQWPLGHARFMRYPGTTGVWEVTPESLKDDPA